MVEPKTSVATCDADDPRRDRDRIEGREHLRPR
jgi:hypothetical protein